MGQTDHICKVKQARKAVVSRHAETFRCIGDLSNHKQDRMNEKRSLPGFQVINDLQGSLEASAAATHNAVVAKGVCICREE